MIAWIRTLFKLKEICICNNPFKTINVFMHLDLRSLNIIIIIIFYKRYNLCLHFLNKGKCFVIKHSTLPTHHPN